MRYLNPNFLGRRWVLTLVHTRFDSTLLWKVIVAFTAHALLPCWLSLYLTCRNISIFPQAVSLADMSSIYMSRNLVLWNYQQFKAIGCTWFLKRAYPNQLFRFLLFAARVFIVPAWKAAKKVIRKIATGNRTIPLQTKITTHLPKYKKVWWTANLDHTALKKFFRSRNWFLEMLTM